MKINVACIPVLVSVTLGLVEGRSSHNNSNKETRGVAPSRQKLYTADEKGNWKCLGGSKTISFKGVNDDYCDCPDGSDEPGTAACGNSYFYCANVGHAPAYIRTSRLNDGVCDPECCDGTDEFAESGGIRCPNICQEVGAEARAERERVRKVVKEGSKIREEYISYGKGLKDRLQIQLTDLQKKEEQIKKAASDAQDALDKAKVKQQEFLESSKADREAARDRQLAPLIEQQAQRLNRAKTIKTLLRSTLEELKENHNKNYHDLAVKNTVTGFDEYLEDLKKREEEDEEAAAANYQNEGEGGKKELTAIQQLYEAMDQAYEAKKEIGRMFQLLKAMKEGYNTEYNDKAVLKAIKIMDDFSPSWLDEQNEFVGEEPIEIPPEDMEVPVAQVKQQASTLDKFYDYTQYLAKSVGLGSLFKPTKSEIESTQETYNKASEDERKIKEEIEAIERKLRMNYGPDEAFAKLVDQCFDYIDTEYTYTLCLFGNAKQKSHSDTFLGKFSSWLGEKYDTQLYTEGTRCWNGPERSVKVMMSCGSVNELVAVSEPEKCEYLFKFRTPAVCQFDPKTDLLEHNRDVVPEAPFPGSVSEELKEEEEKPSKKHDEL
ncbi:glucosidase II beta subunit-like-domain-containing protein [Lobosporangium transversale]|uniref:Glucosidase 2 subunit beta n=1 Tax=Lobosporangium transversale TaxID=64571 RepID=A0A1Y2GRR9_9FUNG|nr:glucosidase II beta subunit-like-domain-containing protein [Lobosporangium transversale]ORZ19163.1 glucosidase II beta subunit-like-domain-containing protein [Lobosporangium transversale]|eukprot:XP_021882331.1 glucosidase II beta subunit-like-domain-containing protein [Lobosporangium transversale]